MHRLYVYKLYIQVFNMPGEDTFWRNGGLKILYKKIQYVTLISCFSCKYPFSALQFFLIVLISVSETTLYANKMSGFRSRVYARSYFGGIRLYYAWLANHIVPPISKTTLLASSFSPVHTVSFKR